MPEQKFIEQLARKLEISPSALNRLLGSVSVSTNENSGAHGFQLGLNLCSELGIGNLYRLEGAIKELICEYRSCCPSCFAWICRGDFNPSRPLSSLTKASLIHACRTASRLRARLFREANISEQEEIVVAN